MPRRGRVQGNEAVDLNVVQHTLRHASIVTTGDLYSNVVPELARSAAQDTARMIPRTKIDSLGLPSGSHQPDVDSQEDLHGDENIKKPQVSNMLTCGL